MPSLTDIANDIKNVLNDVKANTQQTNIVAGQIKADTATIRTELTTINASIQNETVVLSQGLFAIFQAQKLTNSLLLANSEENKTMICWLATIADLLCRELRKMNTQIQLETQMRDDLHMLETILAMVHSRETLEAERLAHVQAEIEKCCPQTEPKPEFCFDPCNLREVGIYQPQGQDWTPPRPVQPPR